MNIAKDEIKEREGTSHHELIISIIAIVGIVTLASIVLMENNQGKNNVGYASEISIDESNELSTNPSDINLHFSWKCRTSSSTTKGECCTGDNIGDALSNGKKCASCNSVSETCSGLFITLPK
jgi:hypothetical protein